MFRHGQWVSTAETFPGAALTVDGRSLGIYQRASVDSFGSSIPAKVSIVDSVGCNLVRLIGGVAVTIEVDPVGFEPVKNVSDLPLCRRRHLFADGKLLP